MVNNGSTVGVEGAERVGQLQVRVDERIDVELLDNAEPVAPRAGALRGIEGEQARLELGREVG
ncbi:MAG: hypothetical protein R3F59_06395 [Myxococcota bacterium]